jgi:hypothetical protein
MIILYFLIVMALMVLDTMTTKICLDTGKIRERNPVLKKIAGNPVRVMIVKTAAALAMLWSFIYFRETPWIPTVVFLVIMTMYSIVILNNIRWYRKIKSVKI